MLNVMQVIKNHVIEVAKKNDIDLSFITSKTLSKCTSQAMLYDVSAVLDKTADQCIALTIKKTFFNKEDKQLALAQIQRHVKDYDERLVKRLRVLALK